jgi:Xaa-Pro aminopeptidase
MILQITKNIFKKHCNYSHDSYHQILTIYFLHSVLSFLYSLFCILFSLFYTLLSMLLLLISTESHPDYTIQRLTGMMPSAAVAVIDTHKQEGVLYLDSRYTSRQITLRPWWTFTKKLRTSWWNFLAQDQDYQISPHCSIATQQTLTNAWLNILVLDSDWWVNQRMVKSDDELQLMQTCYQKSLQVLEHIQTQIDTGTIVWKSCLELRWECIAYAMSLWLTDESFSMIVATGTQTASPHHETDATLIGEWALLIDMGRKYWWYCSDMTRCWWIGEAESDDYVERKKIYDTVQQAKDTCVEKAKPWMTWKEIDGLARWVIQEAWYGDFFTHSTGHGIGLEVHEKPWISSSVMWANTVEEWMCLTVEPWIYLSWKFGVRLEDSYVMSSLSSFKNWLLWLWEYT